MKTSHILLALFVCSFIIPAHAMKREKEGRVTCCNRVTAGIATLAVACTFLTTGLQAHLNIVKAVRSEHNPCLLIQGFHPEFGRFEITPPLCDAQYNVGKLRDIIDDITGEGTTIHAQLTPCDSYERHEGPVKRVIRTCIDRPEEITSIHIKRYTTEPKKER